MAVKSTPALNRFNLFVCLLGLVGLILGLMQHGSREPERLVRDATQTSQPVPVAPVNAEPKAREAYGRLPISFEENRGQMDGRVRFLARHRGANVFLTDNAATFVLSAWSAKSAGGSPVRSQGHAVRMTVEGANPGAEVAGERAQEGRVNYFRGNDPSRWQTDVATFSAVRYRGIYEGVDLVYCGNQRQQLEYDFEVAPRADAHQISFSKPH
jgi:hypothetical protein